MPVNTQQQTTPTCPHCGHALHYDEMQTSDVTDADLFALAAEEGTATICCPVCDTEYWVKGGYQPHYTSSAAEEDL